MDNDLNINNYSLADTLKLFKISLTISLEEYQDAKERMSKINSTYSVSNPKICDFYNKCFKILECIYQYRENKRISDRTYIYDENEENILSFKIKKINDFETISVAVLLDKIYPPPPPSPDPSIFVSPSVLPKEPEKITFVTSCDNMPGVVNPLFRKITNKVLNIDSRFRPNYDSTKSTDYKITLPNEFEKITSMKLLDFEMPTSYFIISSANKNNYFWLKVYIDDNTTKYYYITIPDGNYTFSGLEDKLNNIFLNFSLSIKMSADINTYESGTGRTILKIDSPNKFDINFNTFIANYTESKEFSSEEEINVAISLYNQGNTNNIQSGLGWMMGYRKKIYTQTNMCISEGIFDTSGPKYLYLSVEDYNNNVNDNFYIAMNDNLIHSNILARISLSGLFFTRVSDNFTITSSPRNYFGPVKIQKLSIRLLNEYGNVIDINNMDFSFTLGLSSLYEN